MAKHEKDRLTRLPGKAQFDAALVEEINGDGPVSIAHFDVDRFEVINRESGRSEGDRVLAALAAVLDSGLVADARAYRIGGDEFAVLLPATQKEQAFLTLERVRSDFEALADLVEVTPRPTISIGLATSPDDGTTRQELSRKADDALFRAKSMGANQVALAREEKKVPKTSHYTQGQLDRLAALARKQGVGEAELLREALDELLKKYTS